MFGAKQQVLGTGQSDYKAVPPNERGRHDTPGKRRLGFTLRKVRSGRYRVNFRDGNETTAYYTDRLEDAVNTAIEMARKRELRAAADPVALATR
jgi:hypothetical protein